MIIQPKALNIFRNNGQQLPFYEAMWKSKRFDKCERMRCLRWSYPGHTFLNALQMHSHTGPTLQGSWTHITQNNELSFYTLMPTFWLLFLCSRSAPDEKQLLVRGAVYLEPHCQVILAIWPLGSVLGWYSVWACLASFEMPYLKVTWGKPGKFSSCYFAFV